MIVVVIIAIVAAIAIPGMLQVHRAANERNASTSLKSIATAEYDFRSNDRDTNRIADFWTASVAGLYLIQPVDADGNAMTSIKLIDPSIAGADVLTNGEIDGHDGADASGTNMWRYTCDTNLMTTRGAKSGYWYYALLTDKADKEDGEPYQTITDNSGLPFHNTTRFGFGAFPDSYSVGRSVFMINESAAIIKYPLTATYSRPNPGATPPGALNHGDISRGGVDLLNYPGPADIGKFGRMD